MKKFKTLGVMIDCSRNAVMKPQAVKQLAALLAKMGYNALMLYTEDTFTVDNEPYFGYMRGRYTKEELKDLDAYCNSLGIELIPCIQTLAHLNCMLKWYDEYEQIHDCDDILLIDEDRTYQLIENMFSTLSECFTSKRLHIGMDEAYKVGLGKYLAKHGATDRFNLINKHLHKVSNLADAHGFSTMLWSDMFCKLAAQSEDYYAAGNINAVREKAALPQNTSLVYWDYYSKDYNRYVSMIHTNQTFDRPVIFAGGAWTWKGFAPDNAFSTETTTPALQACADCGVEEIFLTLWGDDGAECSRFSVLPTLFYAAELAQGNSDMDSIKAKFQSLTGADFDSLLLLDALDTPGGKHKDNPSKYLLYNDPFTGINDSRCKIGEGQYYLELAKKLHPYSSVGPYAHLFKSAEMLCEVLSLKTDLGLRTRAAYQTKDLAELQKIATDYLTLTERLTAFHDAFSTQWHLENKPNGFDIQDIRIGGLIQRLHSCRKRLLTFISGETDCIPELQETLLPFSSIYNSWGRCVTPNVISHIV